MDGEPLRAAVARELIRRITVDGIVVPTNHFSKEARKDNLTLVDAINVLTAGLVEEPESENGAWRYRVRTQRITVIVEFGSETELVLVTTWRNK